MVWLVTPLSETGNHNRLRKLWLTTQGLFGKDS